MIPFVNLNNPLPTTPGTGLTAGQEAQLATAARRQPVATIAALKALTPSAGDAVNVLGYAAPGDGGGGQFYYDAAASAADNGGTVIAPTAGSGRWLRAYSGAVNVRWFGAKGDGTTDDTAAIQAALNTCPHVLFPSGVYKVTTGLTLDAFEDIRISGSGGAISFEPPSWPLSQNTPLFSMNDEANSVLVESIIVDGTVAGRHDDDRYCMFAMQLRARSVTVTGCNITNFYGSGIVVVAGTVNIHGNYLYKCSGYNLTSDSGSRDNYGDGIVCIPSSSALVPMASGSISGNYIYTEPDTHRGRGGIVLDNPNYASGKINIGINIRGNYIHGYDRGVHVEHADAAVVEGNYIDKAHAPILVATSLHVVIRSNYLVADSTTAPDGNISPGFKSGLTLYDRECHGAIIDGNTISGLTSVAATIRWSKNIRFVNNDVTGDVSFTGGGYNPGHIIRGNTFSRRSDVSDTGRLWLEASAGLIKDITVCNNTFNNVRVDATWQDGLTICNNYFDFTARDDWAIGVTQSYNIAIEDNIILLGGSATSAVFYSGATRGTFGRCNGNMVRTNATVNLFTNNSLAYQQHFMISRPNFLVRSNNDAVQMTASVGFANGDIGNLGRVIAASSAAIPSGHYVKSSIVYNTTVTAGGIAAQICTTSGYYAPGWAGSTQYRPHEYVTNDGGKVYICTASGMSSSSGGPTGTAASITDGTATWSYVASAATAAFKTLMTASS